MAASMHVNEEVINTFGIKELKAFQEPTITHLLKGEDVHYVMNSLGTEDGV